MIEITDLMGWGYLDVRALREFLDEAENFDIYISDVREDIINCGGDITDINDWIYSVKVLTFNAVMDELEAYVEENIEDNEDLLNEIENLRDNFSPFINYLDSHFNNLLDDIDLTDDKVKIFETIIKELS